MMLEGNVYIVTGGGGGLGAAAARELASLGAAVIVNDVPPSDSDGSTSESITTLVEEIEADGGTVATHFGDITSTEYTEELVEDTVSEHGRIDGAVNFAGILRDSYLTTMTDEEWDAVIDVHLRGHFSLLRSLARHWEERDEGTDRSFVSVSSPSAMGNVGQANYAAAKAGVLGLTRTAAAELERFGVRANALVPIAYTSMTEEFLDPEEYPPERVAPVVAFLLSDAAENVTGRTLRVAGDNIALLSDPEVQRIAFRDDGWTTDALVDRFEEALGEQTTFGN